jgi:hypothetical protein
MSTSGFLLQVDTAQVRRVCGGFAPGGDNRCKSL